MRRRVWRSRWNRRRSASSAYGCDRLVSRFRSSHHCAAHSFANFGIKGTVALYDSSAVFGFEVPTQTGGYNNRNFKSTALALALTSLTMVDMQAAELTILAGGGITGPM